MSTLDPTKVRGIRILVECGYCNGAKNLPGGKYKSQGEVVRCPCCNGSGTESAEVPLSTLYDLLMGNLR